MAAASLASDVTFSVVMPLYNKRAFVRATLESVLAQEHAPLEVIIVDDGSTDGSVEAIADLLDDRVRVLQQQNAGPGPARNRGAEMARGEWIALIDADDRWHPRHLENLASVTAAFPDVDVVSAASRWQAATSIDLALADTATEPRRLDYFTEPDLQLVHTSSIAIRQKAWLSAGGFGAFMPGEDVEFWCRLALAHRFAASPLSTSIYVRENGGIMDNDLRQYETAAPTTSSPIDRLLGEALQAERHRDRWSDIAAFSDRAVLRGARNMLYVGNGGGARRVLRKLHAPGGSTARLYRVASYLPSPLLRGLARSYGKAKKLARRG